MGLAVLALLRLGRFESHADGLEFDQGFEIVAFGVGHKPSFRNFCTLLG